MVLRSCAECGGQVSDAAKACPHCGAPGAILARPKSRRTALKLGIAVLLVIATISLIGPSWESPDSSSTPPIAMNTHGTKLPLASELQDATTAEVAFLCGIRSGTYAAEFDGAPENDYGNGDNILSAENAASRKGMDIAARGCSKGRLAAKLPIMDDRFRQFMAESTPPGMKPLDALAPTQMANTKPFQASFDLAHSNIYLAFLAHHCGVRSDGWAEKILMKTVEQQGDLERAAFRGAGAGADGVAVSDAGSLADDLAEGHGDIAPKSECHLITPTVLHRLDALAKQ